jgi:hypothetical protein
MTTTFYTAAVVEEDGTLRLEHLPFAKGDAVQVYVSATKPSPMDRHPLAGTVLKYEHPTAAVGVEDWAALK